MVRYQFQAGIMFLLLLLCSCVGIPLKQKSISMESIQKDPGKFQLILYGGDNLTDVETIAILDKSEDVYEFKPMASGFRYTIKNDLTASQALDAAEDFLQRLIICGTIYPSSILSPAGEVLGYQIRPSLEDIPGGFIKLSTTYRLLENNIIQAYINWIDPQKSAYSVSR